MEYLKENIRLVLTYLADNLPQIKLIEPDGAYLIWLDFRALGLSEQERERADCEKGWFVVWTVGAMFGSIGEGLND